MKKAKEDIPEKFWREYESLDILGREKKIKHIVDGINRLFGVKNEKVRKHALTIGLMGYFDDLVDYIYNKKVEGKK